jgi:hypothetical protein
MMDVSGEGLERAIPSIIPNECALQFNQKPAGAAAVRFAVQCLVVAVGCMSAARWSLPALRITGDVEMRGKRGDSRTESTGP